MTESLGINLPTNVGGTNSTISLNGSSIMVSNGSAIIQGEKGVSDMVLHGNDAGEPYYAKVDLYGDVTSILPIEHGGTNQFALPTAGQVLIGNLSSFTLGTITAGSGITVTNGNGSITIASSASAGFTSTEYSSAGTFTYNIPAGAKFLDVVLVGAGGGGAHGVGTASVCASGASGGAGMLRKVKIPVMGATTATILVGAGGVANTSGGGHSSVTLAGRQIRASSGGRGALATGPAGRGGGGSAGSANGADGDTALTTGGLAGSATPPGGFHYNISQVGFAGGNGAATGNTSGTMSTLNNIITNEAWILGAGGSGGSYTGSKAISPSGAGGQACQGLLLGPVAGRPGIITGGDPVVPGASGGCSALALGGEGGSFATGHAINGSRGSGGGGGSGSTIQVQRDASGNGGNGGDGYCFINPS